MRKFSLGIFAFVVASVCAADWTPIGSLQIASRENLVARLQPVAAKMNFPMLPVVVEAAFQQIELTKAVGTPAKKSDWGVQLFVDLPKLKKLSESAKEEDINDAVGMVAACPLAKGKAAWQKKHPELKPEADGAFVVDRKVSDDIPAEAVPEEMKKGWKEYVYFSPDGKTAFISQDRDLSKLVAKTNGFFAKPLDKGFLAFETAPNSTALAEIISTICAEAAREARKGKKQAQKKKDKGNDEFQLLPDSLGDKTLPPLMQELVRQCVGLRVTLGASQTGFDLRVKVTPKAGSELEKPSRALPAEALAFKGLPQSTVFAWACTTTSLAPNSPLGALMDAFVAEMFKDFRQHFASDCTKMEKLPKKKQDAQAIAMLKSLVYLMRAAEAQRTGKGTCGWFGCTAADDGKEHTRLVCSFEGLSQPLAFAEKAPAKAHGVLTTVTDTPQRFACEIASQDFKFGKKPMDGCFAKVFPECSQAKTPLFACVHRLGLGIAEGQPPTMLTVGTFAWRNDASYRLLVRMPFVDLLPLLAGLIQMQPDEE